MECNSSCPGECQIRYPACKRPPKVNRAALWGAGYTPNAPSEEAAEIDAAVVESRRCPECSGAMQYEPWHKPGSYIAIAVCSRCGAECEF